MVSGGTSRICIIGGGAAGLAALKVFQETDECQAGLWELVAFEARNELGGVWAPSPPLGNPPASPLYDSLTTNLPHPSMAFSSFWFEPSTPLFPPAHLVLRYLQRYADHFNLTKYIRFNERVEDASWSGQSWEVRADGKIHEFDRLIVANGHYNVPRYPTIPGLQDWLDSGTASHSVYYRNAQAYRNMTMLVIGNGPSGQDICAEVSTVAQTVYHSISHVISEDTGNIKRKGRVVRFGKHGTVMFEDNSVSRIDHAILATGYVMSFPFLPQLRQESLPIVPPLPTHAINSSYSVFPLARHIFPLQDDFPSNTIAFMGLPIRVVPFPLFEAQGRYIVKVFADSSLMNKEEESHHIIARYNRLRDMWGDETTVIAKEWHRFIELEQFSYRRELLDIAGVPQWYPEDWAEEIYNAKLELRQAWKKLESNGEADDWVQGVGEGGREDWVAMMRHLLEVSKN